MSTYFATEGNIRLSSENAQIPIQIHHGMSDPVVPEHLGRKAHKLLSDKGYNTEYHTYPMEHGVCPEQIGDISSWFQKILAS